MLWKLLRSALNPGPRSLIQRGLALRSAGRLPDAERVLREAVQKFPGDAVAATNLGIVLLEQDRAQQGIDYLQQALEWDPRCAAAHHNFANMLRVSGRLAEAAEHYRAARDLDPALPSTCEHLMESLLEVCDWDGAEAEADQLRALASRHPAAAWLPHISPLASSYIGLDPEQQKQVAAYHAQERASRVALARRAPAARAGEGGRLRIGYLSRDFRDHPVGHLLRNAFALHDREQFEIHAFSFGLNDGSVYRKSIEASVDHFVEGAHSTDAELADAIARAGIDVLIDLMGHTTGNRLGVLARRPAPVQAHYLGYPATTGASYIDYFVTDRVVTPPALATQFTETLVHVPRCFMVSDRTDADGMSMAQRSAQGLPEVVFVFCNFANSSRVTRASFRLWMEILRAAPGSVLWLKQSHEVTVKNLRREAHGCGVDPDRLLFARRVPDKAAHMSRLALADLALDTVGWYNGHTSTADALWAGVPVLTLPGATFASRVAASLIQAAGMPELVVRDEREYVARASELARDGARTRKLADQLAGNRASAPFFDARTLVRDLEGAYREMSSLARSRAHAGHC